MILYLQVENQLPENGNASTGRVNTNDAHVDEAIVEYEGVAFPKVVQGMNLWVPAGGGSVVKVEVVPGTLGGTLGAFSGNLVGNVRLGGYFDDGTRFETGDFPVTVRVCQGCLPTTQLCAAGAPTCPPNSNGQLPITCM